MLNNKHTPFFEPGLSELISKNFNSGRLRFSTSFNLAVKNSDIIFICVGTPTYKKKTFRRPSICFLKLYQK